jgi:hypothetical protein
MANHTSFSDVKVNIDFKIISVLPLRGEISAELGLESL